MINLYGIRTTYTPNSYTGETHCDEEKDLIATFDTIKQAKKFVESCKLKTPIQNTWTNNEPYKKRSLLGSYGSVEFESPEEPVSVPHNPEM